VHPLPFGEEVADDDDRSFHRRDFLGDAIDEQRGQQAGEKTARANHDRVEIRDRVAHRGMNRRRWLEPDAGDVMAARVSLVDFDFAARDLAVGVFGAERRMLDADWPHVAAAAQQGAQPVHGGQEVAAVLLHHREQEVAPGVPAEARMVLERRQS